MKPSPRAALYAALLALGAGLLGSGSLISAWWTGVSGEMTARLGLRSLELCGPGRCISGGLDALGSGWAKLATLAMVSGVATAMIALLVAGLAIAARRSVTLAWLSGLLALFSAALGGAVLLARPTDVGDLAPDFGIACFLAGAALIALSSVALRRLWLVPSVTT